MDDFEFEIHKNKRNLLSKCLLAIAACFVIAFALILVLKSLSDIPYSEDPQSGPTAELIDGTSFVVDENTPLADIYENVVDSVVTVVNRFVTSVYPTVVEDESFGSGFIVTEAGHIVTNYHVVSGASQLTVVLYNRNTYPATLINYDEDADIAVLKIEANEDLSVAYIGSSANSRTGDAIFAVGTPYDRGLYGSLTYGRICFAEREMPADKNHYLQIDAAINPGNSGGPLFNMKGEVVGINTYKISKEGVDNLGFAIASSSFKPFVEASLTRVADSRIGIGISGIAIKDTIYANKLDDGVIVISVVANGPADLAGIQPYDIIISINGSPVASAEDIKNYIANLNAGDSVSVDVVRDSSSQIVTLTVVLQTMDFYE